MCTGAEVVSGCRIQAEHRSPYVTAWLSQSVPSYGCISHELVPTTQQQVDVLLFNASSSSSSQQTSGSTQHVSTAWTTNAHLRQHVYLTLKQSPNFGMLFWYVIFICHVMLYQFFMK